MTKNSLPSNQQGNQQVSQQTSNQTPSSPGGLSKCKIKKIEKIEKQYDALVKAVSMTKDETSTTPDKAATVPDFKC